MEENEGKRIKYVIKIDDNFLEGSSLVTDKEEVNLLKEYLNSTFIITELLYVGTRDGFSSSNFHSKIDNKGAVIILIKSKDTN